MDGFSALTRGMRLMLVGGVLLLVDSFLHWQEVSVSFAGFEASAGVNAWHGFWGVFMGLVLVVLLAWLIARLAGVELPALPLSEAFLAAVLAGIVLLFAVLKNLADDYSTRWSYIGIVLAAVIAVGAWLDVQAAGGLDAIRAERGSSPPAPADAHPPDEPPPSTEPTA
jgi:hypothetical protein